MVTVLAAFLLLQSPAPEKSAAYWGNQAALLEARGDLMGAESALRKSLAFAQSDLDRSVALANLTGFLVGLGRMGEARRLAPELEQALERAPADSPAIAAAMNSLGSFFQQEGRTEKSVHWLERALAAASRARANVESRVAIANNLSAALIDLGKPRSAADLLERTLAEPGIPVAQACLTRANLAAARTLEGNRDQARRILTEAFAQADSVTLPLEDHLRLHELGAILLRKLGDKKQASLHKREAAQLASALAERSGARHRVDLADLKVK